MPREHRTDQPLHRPPVLRVIEGELVAARVRPLPAHRRRPVPIAARSRVAVRRVGWGRVAPLTAGVLAAAAAAAGAVWLLVAAVQSLIATVTGLVVWVVAWAQANWVWLLLAAVLLLWLLARLGGGSSCGGLHCRGCRR